MCRSQHLLSDGDPRREEIEIYLTEYLTEFQREILFSRFILVFEVFRWFKQVA